MNCTICKHGETSPAHVSMTLERDGATLIIRNVPAEVCDNCGEQYLDERTSAAALRQAEEAASRGVEVEIVSYKAA